MAHCHTAVHAPDSAPEGFEMLLLLHKGGYPSQAGHFGKRKEQLPTKTQRFPKFVPRTLKPGLSCQRPQHYLSPGKNLAPIGVCEKLGYSTTTEDVRSTQVCCLRKPIDNKQPCTAAFADSENHCSYWGVNSKGWTTRKEAHCQRNVQDYEYSRGLPVL